MALTCSVATAIWGIDCRCIIFAIFATYLSNNGFEKTNMYHCEKMYTEAHTQAKKSVSKHNRARCHLVYAPMLPGGRAHVKKKKRRKWGGRSSHVVFGVSVALRQGAGSGGYVVSG